VGFRQHDVLTSCEPIFGVSTRGALQSSGTRTTTGFDTQPSLHRGPMLLTIDNFLQTGTSLWYPTCPIAPWNGIGN
jgi:hypothetical protein